MTLMKTFLGATAAMALTAGAAAADPAIIFDLGGKFDKSFNEAAFQGAQRWAEETGGSFRRSRIAVRRTARAGSAPLCRSWCKPDRHGWFRIRIIAGRSGTLTILTPSLPSSTSTGSTCQTYAALALTKQKARTRWYGMLAAHPRAEQCRFVGGMDIPLIRKFACGYAQGAMAANPDANDHCQHDRHNTCCME